MQNLKIFFLALLLFLIFSPKLTLATTFDLYASTRGPYNRGQEITFTIDIDTEGANLTNTAVGMIYNTQYLELINTLPGSTFPTITTNDLGGGKLIFYGQTSAGFSGKGKFVDVVFKLIAQAPGSTQLCVLWNPEVTPTSPSTTRNPSPTSSTSPSTTTNLSITPTTSASPPVSGDGKAMLTLSKISGLLIASGLFFFIGDKLQRIKTEKKLKKTKTY